MKLSIIIPAYNEGKTIGDVLRRLDGVRLSGIEKEVIVVDDGSSDNTKSVVQKRIDGVKLIVHKTNQGKGAAVKTGITHATGDYILIQDADMEYNPSDIEKLITPIKQGRARVVYGTRLKRMPDLSKDERTPNFFLQYLGNKFLSFVTSVLYGQWITDMETGYKVFPREAVDNMSLDARSFDFEPEITAKLLKRGYPITEVKISTNPRDYSQGKKLRPFRDGPIALWTLIKCRFFEDTNRNP